MAPQISEYDGTQGAIARVSPLILGNTIIIGDNQGNTKPHAGPNIIAIDSATGKLKWITKVNKHPAAIITGSPVALDNVVYVGVSSNEESLSVQPGYPCCTFRGSLVALDALSGKILW
jgi:polyvinyl alcohol dehydrogenase (cytochrome)